MPEPYSPLRYPGGKAKLSSFIIEVLHHNDLKEPHYLEPYAGGAGAALRLLFEEYVESITINDADLRIRCFWIAITKHTDAFLGLLENVEVNIEEWYRQREVYRNCDLRKVLKVGFATFFLNRTNRSGIIHNSGPIGGYDQTGNYKIDARFNREQLARRIQRIGIYSDRIRVDGIDGLSLLKKTNQNWLYSKRTFVYLDPPYYGKGANLYMNPFTHKHHVQLAEYLRSPKNFPWIMTYDNVEAIKELYKRFPQFGFSLSYSAYERRRGQELLIHPESIKIPQQAKEALPAAA